MYKDDSFVLFVCFLNSFFLFFGGGAMTLWTRADISMFSVFAEIVPNHGFIYYLQQVCILVP